MATKKPVVIAVIVLALLLGAGYLTRNSWTHLLPGMSASEGGFRVFERDGARYKECYVCPMHLQVVKPAPGDCPICGMSLIKKELPVETTTRSQKEAMPSGEMKPEQDAGPFKVVEKDGVRYRECYTCPMHPQIIKPGPGDCPICGMTLVKKLLPLEGEDAAGHAGHKMDEGVPEGLMKISLDPRQRVLANVATAKVAYRELSGEIYTVGRIAVNEDTIRKAAAWFPGRIERIYLHYPGEYVKKGQRIMSVYSPELVSTQKEYLIAKGAAQRLGSSGFPEITRGTDGVVEAARTRMRLWGATDEQIQRLDDTGTPDGSLDVYSKVSGTVTEIMAREGGYVKEGSELFTVADYGTVWVNAEVYEYEFSKVSMGAHVEITADAYPGRTFHGKVSFIDPVVDSQSRTVRVRAVIKNTGGLLKPEMFVNARIMSGSRRALTVPASAVLYTGRRNVVWVETAPGVYEPRDITLGLRAGEEFEVLSGLADGEIAVTQGGFLIDSEAQLLMSAGGGKSMPGMDMGGVQEKSGGEKTDMGGQTGHVH